MEAIWWAIVGIIAGLLSRWVLPREDTDSVLLDIAAGAVGAVAGGYLVYTYGLSHSLGWYAAWSALMALAGAVSLLLVVGGLTTRDGA